MALNLDAVGKKIGPITKEYTWKDAVLYALGVGAGFSDLEYCYEKDLKVIPSFSITTIYDTMPEALALTDVNLAGILHYRKTFKALRKKQPPAFTVCIKWQNAANWLSQPLMSMTRLQNPNSTTCTAVENHWLTALNVRPM